MLLKRIELLLDPEVDAIGLVAMRKDGSTYLRDIVKLFVQRRLLLMATKKIFRLDLLTEWLRSSVDECDSCPIASACFELDDNEILCDRKRAEEFKQAIIDRFSTEVEVQE